MDLESIADELYALPPQEFVGARGRHQAAARKAKDRELADRIGALRRPTLSAWASNLLVRDRPDQVAGLLRLGEGLRRAHQELDPEQLRTLSRQQHAVVGELARQARRLAAEAGHPVSDEAQHEVEATLHAVLADPQAAQEWADGHLVRPLSPPVGFTAGAVAGAPAHKAPASPSARKGKPTGVRDRAEAVGPASTARERERKERRRRALDQARKDAEEARERARERESDLQRAEEERERAETALAEAKDRAATLARELKEAQGRQRSADRALDHARQRATKAGRDAGEARRDARAAEARAERSAADRD
ncbi:hypothetical protein [Streptomyces sp. NPDC002889]|uniref:hypothetical protein n=1 Tax=Streptomyces sp. NPDC002889 TaxID=3364669 RepID=UPI0036AF373B